MSDTPPDTAPHAGRTFGRYHLEEALGSGRAGTREVWKARDTVSGQLVALKRMRPEAAAATPAREQFLRAARAAMKLRHPEILRVHEVGDIDGCPYFTTDLLAGRTFATLIEATRDARRKGTDGGYARLREEIRLLADVASAVGYAHLQGVVHGDLQPANLWVDPSEQVYVADFGLGWGGKLDEVEARRLRALGLTESPAGAPGYLSPEQAAGQVLELGAATDIFSLGVLLYEVLTGQTPFARANAWEMVAACAREEAAPARRSHPRAPADLEVVCLKALDRDPKQRYQTADQLAEDLRRWLLSRPVAARKQEAPATRTFRRLARRSRRGLAASVAVLVLAGVGAWSWSRAKEAELLRLQAEGEPGASGGAYEALVEGVTGLEDRLFREDLPREELERTLTRLAVAASTLIAERPKCGPVYAWRGELSRLQGRTGEADTDSRRACELSPGETVVWYLRGRARLYLHAARRGLPIPYAGTAGVEFERGSKENEFDRSRFIEGLVDLRHLATLPGGKLGIEERRLGLALLCLHGGEAGGYEAALRQVEGSTRAEACWVRGQALYRLRRFPEAALALEKAVAAWPRHVAIRCDEALARLAIGLEAQLAGRDPRELFRKAIQGLTEGSRASVDDPGVCLARGLAYLGIGRAETPGKEARESCLKALENFSAAINHSYGVAEVYFSRGQAYCALQAIEAVAGPVTPGRLDSAINDFVSARDRSVDARAALTCLAAAYLAQAHADPNSTQAGEKYKLAIRDYDELLASDGKDAAVLEARGGARADLARCEAGRSQDPRDNYRGAVADLTAVLEHRPAQGSARCRRAEAYAGLAAAESARGEEAAEDCRRALADCDAVLASEPGRAEAYLVRARARRCLGATEAFRGHDPRGSYRLALEDCGAALARKPDWDEARLERGDVYRAMGAAEPGNGQGATEGYRKALEDYDAVLARKPQSFEALVARGCAYHGLGMAEATRGEDARPTFAKALADYVAARNRPFDRVELQTCVADLYRSLAREDAAHGADAQGNLYQAAAAYAETLRRTPDAVGVRLRLAETQVALAETDTERGRDPRPNYQKAIESLTAMVTQPSTRLEALAGRGRVGTAFGAAEASRGGDPRARFAQAVADLTEVLEHGAGDLGVRCGRAEAYAGLAAAQTRRGGDARENFRLAFADCDAVLAKDPGLPAAALVRATAGLTLGDFEEGSGQDGRATLQRAIQDCEALLAREPKRVEGHLRRGRAYEALGTAEAAHGQDPRASYRKALEDYRGALTLAPKSVAALAERGEVYLRLGAAEALRGMDVRPTCKLALADFDAALALSNEVVEVRRRRGAAFRTLGDAEAARDLDPRASYAQADNNFRSAIALGLAQAGLDLGLLLAAQGRFEPAIGALEACARAMPTLASTLERRIADIRRQQAEPWFAELAAAERAALTGARAGARPHYETGMALLDRRLAGLPEKERAVLLADARVREYLSSSHYNLACVLALAAAGRAGEGEAPPVVTADEAAGLRDAAFGHLDKSLEFGAAAGVKVGEDEELESLHADPRWLPFLERIRK